MAHHRCHHGFFSFWGSCGPGGGGGGGGWLDEGGVGGGGGWLDGGGGVFSDTGGPFHFAHANALTPANGPNAQESMDN